MKDKDYFPIGTSPFILKARNNRRKNMETIYGQIAEEIAEAIYIPKTETKRINKIKQVLLDQIDDETQLNSTIATNICDALDIPRRDNRAAIREVLNKYRNKEG
jgi:hypothetical protein